MNITNLGYRTWVELNQEALRGNAKALRSLLSKEVALLAMVKANAYGHGLTETVSALDSEVDWFGVDTLHEGLLVRKRSKKPVIVTGGFEVELADEIVLNGFHQVVSDISSLEALSKSAKKLEALADIHIKVDTGMSRQGVCPNKLPKLLETATTLPNINVFGIATHFANADEPNDGATSEQLELFNEALATASRYGFKNIIRHSANSAAMLTRKDTHFDLVRVGIAIYGVWPSAAVEAAASLTLKPTLSWKTRVVQVKDVSAGSNVGYGLTDKLSRDSRIVVLPVGYADGYDRRLSRTADVLLGGARARVVGNVSMDMLTVDITDIPDIKVGDIATLIGEGGSEIISAQELAQKMDTIHYEVLARINPTLARIVV